MTITEFAKAHHVQSQTISIFIKRHEDLFEGHTKRVGKTIELDEEALKVLDEKYPLPKPVEVIEDIETIKELAATRKELADTRKILIEKEEKISELQEQLLVASRQIVQAEAMQLLVEDKKEQLQKEMEKSAKLHEELYQEKAKTWIQKLFGK